MAEPQKGLPLRKLFKNVRNKAKVYQQATNLEPPLEPPPSIEISTGKPNETNYFLREKTRLINSRRTKFDIKKPIAKAKVYQQATNLEPPLEPPPSIEISTGKPSTNETVSKTEEGLPHSETVTTNIVDTIPSATENPTPSTPSQLITTNEFDENSSTDLSEMGKVTTASVVDIIPSASENPTLSTPSQLTTTNTFDKNSSINLSEVEKEDGSERNKAKKKKSKCTLL